jgi:hypothetical protein
MGYGPSVKPISAMSLYAKPAHKRMSRVLGYCLTLGDADAWSGFATVAAARLSQAERAALACASLKSLDAAAVETVAAACIRPAETPLPPFLGGMDDARAWASYASRSELKAYALAAFEALSASDQSAFFQHISNVRIAV